MDIARNSIKTIFKPSTAWLFLFFPALCYYVSTQLHSLGLFRSSTYGIVIPHEIQWIQYPSLENPSTYIEACSQIQTTSNNNFLFLQKDCQSLRYPLYVVENNFQSIVATTWKEDIELGRGFLLISTSYGKGKIWRWETGGGPIAIGKTLHLNDSGCRSNLYQNCTDENTTQDDAHYGSGGIAVDVFKEESPRLVVAEYGEGRVSRLEENGARTPLVIEASSNQDGVSKRLCRPFRLLMTPFQDLMIMDNTTNCGQHGYVLWKLSKVTDIPPLPSLLVSRQAHAWKRLNSTNALPEVFLTSELMGGMVVDPSGKRLYVTTSDRQSSTVLVISLPLVDDLDDDDDDDDSNTKENQKGQKRIENEELSRELLSKQSTLVLNYTAHASVPGAIEIDDNGNIYLAVDEGILIISDSQTSIVKITLSTTEKIKDLTVGSDRFLYIATERHIIRFRIPGRPLEIKKEKLRLYL